MSHKYGAGKRIRRRKHSRVNPGKVLLFVGTASAILILGHSPETEAADPVRIEPQILVQTLEASPAPIDWYMGSITGTRTMATQSPDPVCPITESETIMLAKTMYAESQILFWQGTQFGVSYQARQAAVAWCALNRVDDTTGAFPDTLSEVLSYPNAFAYDAGTPVTEEMLELARDVVDRWWEEKCGAENVGRTLPAEYLYFHGDGRENHFRTQYEHTGGYWDWSLEDPYGGVQ